MHVWVTLTPNLLLSETFLVSPTYEEIRLAEAFAKWDGFTWSLGGPT